MIKKLQAYRAFCLACVLVLVCVLQYSNTFEHGYVWDDLLVVTGSDKMQEGLSGLQTLLTEDEDGHSMLLQRLVPMLTFAVDIELFGSDPHAAHVMNVLYYSALCVLLFFVLRTIFVGYSIWFSFIVVLLFAVHPLHVEVVANIKSRDEILALLLSMTSFWFALKFVEKKKLGYYIGTLICFVLAFLSKESAFVFALLIPIMLILLQNPPLKLLMSIAIPLVVFINVWLSWRLIFGISFFSLPIWQIIGVYTAPILVVLLFYYIRNGNILFEIKKGINVILSKILDSIQAMGIAEKTQPVELAKQPIKQTVEGRMNRRSVDLYVGYCAFFLLISISLCFFENSYFNWVWLAAGVSGFLVAPDALKKYFWLTAITTLTVFSVGGSFYELQPLVLCLVIYAMLTKQVNYGSYKYVAFAVVVCGFFAVKPINIVATGCIVTVIFYLAIYSTWKWIRWVLVCCLILVVAYVAIVLEASWISFFPIVVCILGGLFFSNRPEMTAKALQASVIWSFLTAIFYGVFAQAEGEVVYVSSWMVNLPSNYSQLLIYLMPIMLPIISHFVLTRKVFQDFVTWFGKHSTQLVSNTDGQAMKADFQAGSRKATILWVTFFVGLFLMLGFGAYLLYIDYEKTYVLLLFFAAIVFAGAKKQFKGYLLVWFTLLFCGFVVYFRINDVMSFATVMVFFALLSKDFVPRLFALVSFALVVISYILLSATGVNLLPLLWGVFVVAFLYAKPRYVQWLILALFSAIMVFISIKKQFTFVQILPMALVYLTYLFINHSFFKKNALTWFVIAASLSSFFLFTKPTFLPNTPPTTAQTWNADSLALSQPTAIDSSQGFILTGLTPDGYVNKANPRGIYRESPVLNNSIHTATNPFEKIATSSIILLKYFKNFFVPTRLLYFYGYNQIPIVNFSNYWVWLSILLHLGLIVFVFRYFKQNKFAVFGVLFYLMTIFLYTHLIIEAPDTMADRYYFTASLGVCIMVVLGLGKLLKIDFLKIEEASTVSNKVRKERKKRVTKKSSFVKTLTVRHFIFGGILCSVMSFYAYLTYERNKVWKDDLTLFETDLPYLQNCARAHYYYATELAEQIGVTVAVDAVKDKIIYHFNKSIEIHEDSYFAYMNLARVYQHLGQQEEAYNLLKKAETVFAEDMYVKLQLGRYFYENEEWETALSYLEVAYPTMPQNEEIYSYYAWSHFNVGNYKEAIQIAKEGIKQLPNAYSLQILLSDIHFDLGEHDQAIRLLKQIIERQSNFMPAYQIIVNRYRYLGDNVKAQQYLQMGQTKGFRIQ